jgi:predicted nucleic acid-binding protein
MDNDDLEDAIQAASAMANGCSMIISRNPNHFDGTGMKCLRPEEFVV